MSFRLESLVNKDGIVMMQLKGEDHIIGFASFHIDVAKEFTGSMLILKDKLEATGLDAPIDHKIEELPTAGDTSWNLKNRHE